MTNLKKLNEIEDLLPRSGSALYNLNHMDDVIKKKTLRKYKILNKYVILPLYRLKILPLLGFGRIFLILTTQGRKTGKKRKTPLEYQRINGILTIFSSRGEDAGWMKNIRAHPDSLLVSHGFHHFQPQVEFVTNNDQKLEIIRWYVMNHGKPAKFLFGWIPKVDKAETTDFSKMLKMITIIRLHYKNDKIDT